MKSRNFTSTQPTVVVRKARVFLILLVGLLSVGVLAGCSTPPPPPPPPPAAPPPAKPSSVEHTIQYKGETLGLISKWYTGNPANWNLIIQANPGLKPNRMNLGNVITIPGDIVTRREPMPKSFIPKFVAADPSVAKDEAATQKPVDAAADGDSAAKEDNSKPSTKPTTQDPTVDQLLEELADSAKTAPAKQEPPVPAAVPPAPPVEAVPPPPPPPAQKVPAQAGDAEREQLLDELLGQ